MADLPHVKTDLGDVRAHTERVAEEITRRWTLYYVWGISDTGHHAAGRALDFMTSTENQGALRDRVGYEISAYCQRQHARLGVEYIIFRQRIWNATRSDDRSRTTWSQWRQMEDRGDPTANHMDHVHLSLLDDPPPYRPPEPVKPPPGWKDAADIPDVVRGGDTLGRIAAYYSSDGGSVTAEQIAERNDLADPTALRVGQGLWIPAPGFHGQPRTRRMHLATAVARARDNGEQLRWQDNTTRGVKWCLAQEGFLPTERVDGIWGPRATEAYGKWQQKYSDAHDLGWHGDDLDGVPGRTSLKALAEAYDYGFSG